MSEMFFAKSVLPNGKQPTVKEHMEAVVALARVYGAEISMEEAAALAAVLHDFGKYSQSFQALLRGQVWHIDHAVCGAALIATMYPKGKELRPIVEAIFAHHDGLRSYETIWPTLKACVQEKEPIDINGKTAALAGKEQYIAAFQQFRLDFPQFCVPHLPREDPGSRSQDDEQRKLRYMLATRMLLSCLVDADYSASAREENEHYLEDSERLQLVPKAALKSLEDLVSRIRMKSKADAQLNILRTNVYTACGGAAMKPPGAFTLTAPTGTGKTLALLHFALRHSERWQKKRIILVLPFLSLTEQSADTYREVLSDVLVDTSQSELGEEAKLYAERWRVPVIVTTSVKFFESLFKDRPSDCRRLHNIANSVILFDEAQSLPPELTRATVCAADELCRRYGCTMVFSTATQPDFSAIPGLEEWSPVEILTDYPAYYSALKRTRVEWRLKDGERMTWERLAPELASENSVCVIVNLKAHARKLYRLLKKQCEKDEVFFLTTDLCPAHRSEVLRNINERLANGLPCRVVSTQCIEAGVDLDFAAVYRALAPLESIIQAAGRCNRNGVLPGLGRVVVFRPMEEGYPGSRYQNAAETVRRLCAEQLIDIHDPAQIRLYYQRVFSDLKDKPELRHALKDSDYSAVSQAYRLIDKKGVQVIVPYMGERKLFNTLRDEIRADGITPALMRRAAPITVSCFAADKLETCAERLPYARKGKMSDCYLMREQCLQDYLPDMGFQMEESPDFDGIF